LGDTTLRDRPGKRPVGSDREARKKTKSAAEKKTVRRFFTVMQTHFSYTKLKEHEKKLTASVGGGKVFIRTREVCLNFNRSKLGAVSKKV